MIWEGIARNLIVEVGCIIFVLESGTEIEDPVMLSVATCQKFAYRVPVVSVEGFNAVCRETAGGWDIPLGRLYSEGLIATYQMMIRSVTSALRE
jgi:hypothetical protein